LSDTAALLEIRDLRTEFRTRRGLVPAVDEVSLSVGRGEVVGIVGESGCGKSVTSLSILGLVTQPGRVVGGSALFDGTDLLKLDNRGLRAIRGREISMIFQEPMTSLNPVYTVGKQVAECLQSHSSGVGRRAARRTVAEMFAMVGIPEPEKRLDSWPHQLSGGLRQRVMIAMALICKPKLLIADEPTTALDVTIEAQILALMKDLRRDTGTSIMLISHNLGVIAETCDRVYVMYAGKVMEEADVFELFDGPAHPYTRGLLASMPRLDGALPGGGGALPGGGEVLPGGGEDLPGGGGAAGPRRPLYSIRGNVPDMQALPRGCRFAPRCDFAMEKCRESEPPLLDAGKEGGRIHLSRCWLAGGLTAGAGGNSGGAGGNSAGARRAASGGGTGGRR
jgi:peptide/nickel transport system ATP-binding protein/oligopeptide transport system ATP-binding protein